MNYRLFLIASVFFGGCWANQAAANGNCPPASITPTVTMNVDHSLTTAENTPGATFEVMLPTVSTQMGPCHPTDTSVSNPTLMLSEVYSSTTPLSETGGWLRLNDDLDIQVDIGSSSFAPTGGANWLVPFGHKVGAGKVQAGVATSSTITPNYGNAGKITFRLRRPIAGQVIIPMTEVASLWGCVPDDGSCFPSGAPIYRYSLAGTLTVPATCSINAGATIAVDFGEMSTGDFSSPGQVAQNAMRPVRVPVQCGDGVQGDANLSVSFTATPATQNGNAIATSNPELGIAIGTDSNLSNASTWITPNTGSIPLQLDGSGAAEISLFAAPVRVGNQPQAGAFNGVATIKLAIP